jgi:Fic family protein
MRTFTDLDRHLAAQPPRVGVLLSRSDVGRGREDLYLDQLPELLRALAQRTRVESVQASTAIEGYEVDDERAAKLIAQPNTRIRNRNEREFAGYRDAIEELMSATETQPISLPLVMHLHRRLFAHTGGRGGHFKTEDNAITTHDEQGRRVLIFQPPPWQETEFLMGELVVRYESAVEAEAAHPLVLLGAFVLDFLAIHPVADGNGRLARLLTTRELLRSGYGVARYVSVEQRIYESKHSYYQALKESQRGWHQGQHDVWPWIEYLASVLAEAYADFEGRVAAEHSMAGKSKQQITREHVLSLGDGRRFKMRDLRALLPGISDPTFRLVLEQLKREQEVRVDGRGRGAIWTRTDAFPDFTISG